MIRADFRVRLVVAVLAVALLGLTAMAMMTDRRDEWKSHQETFQEQRIRAIEDNIRIAGTDEDEARKWTRLLTDARASDRREVRQIFLPDANVRDLCQTCHSGMEDPLFAEAGHPLKTHPAAILASHPLNRFGCTLCHQGQGVALSRDKAHGFEDNWETPRVPKAYIQGLCMGCHDSPHRLDGAGKAAEGKRLFIENGCFGCHEEPTLSYLPYMSTMLDGAALKIRDPGWLVEWLREPAGIRPHTRMPGFRLEPAEVAHVAAYVRRLDRPPAALTPYRSGRGDADRGKTVFTEKGCIACHSADRDEPGVNRRAPNLADAGIKLAPDWLWTWLDKPATLMPETPMPLVLLTPEEREHAAAYVLSLNDAVVRERIKDDAPEGDPAEGRRVVQSLGCYGCHEIKEMKDTPLVGVAVADVAKKRLEELPFGDSTVPHTKWDWLRNKIRRPDIYTTRDMPLKMPDHVLSEEDIEALATFYLHNKRYALPETYLRRQNSREALLEKGDWMVAHYQCNACHQIGEQDPQPRIADYLTPRAMIPPRLVGQGGRVQPRWFFNYLDRPDEMRLWLKIRMPTFNLDYEDKKDLIAYFSLLVSPEDRDIARIPYEPALSKADHDPEIIQMGEYRLVTDKCMQCHPVSMDDALPEDVKVEDLAINLMLSKTRLRFEWIKRFLRDPDKYAGKGTKMPYVYYTPDGVPRIPDPEMWIEYTTLYLMFMETVPETPVEKKLEDVREEAFIDWTDY